MISGALARRYAKALLEEAMESQAAEAVRAELRDVVRLFSQERELCRLLLNPAVRRRDALAVLDDVAVRLAASPLTRTFLKLVAEAGRLAGLEGILRAYEALLDERLGRVRATVTSAAPLSPAMQADLAAQLGRLTGKQVVLEVAEDPALLGGMITRVGSTVYDGSLKTRVLRLRQALATGD